MFKLTSHEIKNFSQFVKAQFRNIQISPTIAMNELSKKLSNEGKKIIKFGFGQSPFPVPQSLVDELQKNASQKDYLPVGGLPKLNEAICNFYKKKNQLGNYKFFTDNIIVGPGSKQLMFWLQLVFNGDIVIPVPSWVSYGPQSILCRNKIHYIQTKFENNWHVTQQDIWKISKKIKSRNKLIMLNSPNNPTGTHPNDVQRLAKALRDNNFIVFSDDIYSELTFDKNLKQIANYYPEKTIISTGLSKWCGAGGWRLGFQLYPPELKQLLDMIKVIGSQTFSSVSAPAYSQDHSQYIKNTIKILKATSEYVYQKLIDADIKVKKPSGGFYLMPDLTQILSDKFNSSRDMYHNLLTEENIAVLPGVDFGFKLSYVDFNGQQFLNFVQKYPYQQLNQQILVQMAPNIVDGTRRLVRWINKNKN